MCSFVFLFYERRGELTLDRDLLDQFVKELYDFLSIASPGFCINNIAKQLNIQVHYFDDEPESLYLRGRYHIFLNEFDSRQKHFQDFAYELFHVLLHVNQEFTIPLQTKIKQEWGNENFALHFCIPQFMINSLNFKKMGSNAVKRTSQIFEVEIEFATKRLAEIENNEKVLVTI